MSVYCVVYVRGCLYVDSLVHMEVRGQQQMSSSGVLPAPYLVRKGILLILGSPFLLEWLVIPPSFLPLLGLQ